MKFKSIAAILVAGIMAVSVSMVAMAKDHGNTDYTSKQTYSAETHTNIGSIMCYDEKALEAKNGANVQVNRDVAALNTSLEAAQPTGLIADGTGTYVQIDGNVSGTAQGAFVFNSAEVHVAGNVISVSKSGAVATSNAKVYIGGNAISTDEVGLSITDTGSSGTVSGDAKGKEAGVYAKDGATAIVIGCAESTGTGASDAAIKASIGATVTAGSVKANNNGIEAFGDATLVVVSNDVYAHNRGVQITGGAPTVVVEGTVITEGDTPAGVTGTGATTNLFIYELKKTDGGELDSSYNQVNYIIKTAGTTDAIQLQGVKTTDTILGKTYDYANGGDAIIVSVKQGYRISSPLATKNADGTYTIIVPNGGGITIEAIMQAIKKSGASFTSTPTSMGSASAPLTGGTWTNIDGRWTYAYKGEKLINCTAWIQYTNALGQTVTQKFYFDNNGKMITNAWKQTADGTWNYFGADGAMLANTTTPDGYVVDANGNWVKAQ